MKVLVSNPSYDNNTVWLPYLWGRLRLQCTVDVEWLDPIFFAHDARTLVRSYDRVDVLLLSCYVWNWKKNLEIAHLIKKNNPACYIVAGGPQVTNTPEWDICDKIWQWESEDAIDDILLKRTPSKDRVDLSKLDSPYHIYKKDYKRFAEQIRKKSRKDPAAIWETNRGCPYKCTFCDWGSLTNSKIRRFRQDIIIKDIEALSDIQVGIVFNADANYGIFKEDLLYAEHIAKMKQESGYPKTVFFSSAKNKKDITNAAAKVLYDNQMIPTLQISYQHTDPDVLAAIKRDNISTQKLKDELEEGFRNNIPLVGVVIMGNPGDTVDKWKKGLGDLLDIGFHEDIRYHDFMVLPNAPAADPTYMDMYGIKTMTRSYDGRFDAEFIRSTNTFTSEDFTEIQTYTSYLVSYHVLNITRYLAMFLKYYKGIDYIQFYDKMLEQATTKRLVSFAKQDLQDWINGRMRKEVYYKGRYITHDFYIKTMALQNLGGIVLDCEDSVVELTDMDREQASELVKAQYRTIVGWWPQHPTKIKYNFIEAFANLQGLPPNTDPKPWKINISNHIVSTNQSTIGDQKKIDITHIKDFDSWFNSPIHKGENVRNGMNHYQEIFDNVLY